ncbi:MAG: hypothetical protein H6712_12455 [Myxococcales bacterium]|nr:hypothetical protein [Myxococcales bacterium]MCB9714668.1 hypothetical protein [Myxococcales bacterium]
MSLTRITACLGLGLLAIPGCDAPDDEGELGFRAGARHKPALYNTGSYNVHLERSLRFNPQPPGSDADAGRATFGVAADLETQDDTSAIFEGDSPVAGHTVVSNGRVCFTCHRGASLDFGMPPPPVSDSIALSDPLFTGIDADAQGDPDAMLNLDQLALFKIRPNRFNPTRSDSDPFRQVFGWRKSPALTNVGLAHGFLTDVRGRTMFETARGAAFSHTQETDERFDDLFSQQQGDDIGAFLFEQVSDPALLALRDPGDPGHQALADDPFATVPVSTPAQHRGQKVFEKYCYGACHNTPNVFNSLENVEAVGNGERPTSFAPQAPAIGKAYNVGISEANLNNLRFTRDNGDGTFTPIVLPLAAEDGALVEYEVAIDVGLAATSGRYEDVGRFKVPALRNVAAHAPYMHDNSIDTLEGVVDYFCSDEYNDSKDGQLYPIDLNAQQRADLIAFLEIL